MCVLGRAPREAHRFPHSLQSGHYLRMSTPRVGPFWDSIEGRAPMPPVAELLGWTLESIDPQGGNIVVRFEARPEFTNPLGNVQGGLLAAMLDDTMGPALVATLPPG